LAQSIAIDRVICADGHRRRDRSITALPDHLVAAVIRRPPHLMSSRVDLSRGVSDGRAAPRIVVQLLESPCNVSVAVECDDAIGSWGITRNRSIFFNNNC
jgi:hypothetical protein